jgi:hypothetical protein
VSDTFRPNSTAGTSTYLWAAAASTIERAWQCSVVKELSYGATNFMTAVAFDDLQQQRAQLQQLGQLAN